MKIRAEYKVPIEYMPFDVDVDWVKRRVANQIFQHMLSENLIEFTEEWRDGYYILSGEVLCESLSRAIEFGEQLLRLSIDK